VEELVVEAPEKEPAAVVVTPGHLAWAIEVAVEHWNPQSQPLKWESPDVAGAAAADVAAAGVAAVSAADWQLFPIPRRRRGLAASGDPSWRPNDAGQAAAVEAELRLDQDSSGPATSRRVPLRSGVCWDDD